MKKINGPAVRSAFSLIDWKKRIDLGSELILYVFIYAFVKRCVFESGLKKENIERHWSRIEKLNKLENSERANKYVNMNLLIENEQRTMNKDSFVWINNRYGYNIKWKRKKAVKEITEVCEHPSKE